MMANQAKNHKDFFAKALLYGFLTMGAIVISVAGYSAYLAHLQFIHPSNVYGEWVEIGSPPYQTDTLSFSESGVIKNHRLISTQFEFDGKVISVETGSGTSLYQLAGTYNSPRLNRLQPAAPSQRFVKKGYEHTAKMLEGSAVQARRESLADQFQ